MSGHGWSIGIDVGGTKMLAVAVPNRVAVTSGAPRSFLDAVADWPSRQVATPTNADDVVDAAVGLWTSVCGDGAVDRVTSVGLGLPGFIDRSGIAQQAPNLAPIVGRDLGGPLVARTGVPVTIDNDANCAAWAAACLDAPDADSVVAITLGTGIGGGIVINRQLVRGAHGFAGEPGHMVVDPNGPRCVCGQRGCWEVWASGTGLGRLATAAIEAGDASDLASRPGPIDGPLIMALASQGHPDALRIRRRFAGWVALGLVNLVNLIDPEVVVLSGGIVAEGEELLVAVRDALDEYPTMGPGRELDLRISRVGPSAGAIGAALLAAAGIDAGMDAGGRERHR